MEMKFNIPINYPPEMEASLQKVFHGEYDVFVHFHHGVKIVDLGANLGSFAIWAAHRFPGSEIYSYEPHPETYKGLTENTSRYSQIKCFNWGIGLPGERILHDGPNNSGERSFHAIMNVDDLKGMKCEVKAPETLPECDILKLDIEGCEMEVLKPLIERGRRPILILLEFHNHKLRREVDSLLSDYELIGGEIYNSYGLGVGKYILKQFIGG